MVILAIFVAVIFSVVVVVAIVSARKAGNKNEPAAEHDVERIQAPERPRSLRS